jgi:hypothetical protein
MAVLSKALFMGAAITTYGNKETLSWEEMV